MKVQKMFFQFLILLMLCQWAHAQETKILVGPDIGINWAKLEINLANIEGERKTFNRLTLALAVEARFSGLLGLQSGLALAQRGMKVEEIDSYQDGRDYMLDKYTTQLYIDYLELPVLGKLMLPISDRLNFHMQTGPRIGFGLSGKLKFTKEISSNGIVIDRKVEEESMIFDASDGEAQVKRFDYGLDFGTGLEFELGNGFLALNVRYYMGLANINSYEEMNASKIKNRG